VSFDWSKSTVSLEGILSSGLSALLTNSAALRVTSNNIANANNPNYARRVVQQGPLIAGGQISGVKVEEIQRMVNVFLDQEVIKANSSSHYDEGHRDSSIPHWASRATDSRSAASRGLCALGQASQPYRVGLAARHGGRLSLARSISDLSGSGRSARYHQ
jgi:hypothetical protein